MYTGGSPAGGTSATLAGYINQVIKTGTFPGYAQANLGIGTPAFYHKAGVEAGGATPDRLFSWYVGVQGSNQTYNTLDNTNGANQPIDGSGPNGIFSSVLQPLREHAVVLPNGTFSTCGPNGAPPGALGYDPTSGFGGVTTAEVSQLSRRATPTRHGRVRASWACPSTPDRENVVNFHFGIPHHNDAGRDDVQVLYYNFAYHQDFGGAFSIRAACRTSTRASLGGRTMQNRSSDHALPGERSE